MSDAARPPIDDLAARLERERLDADRRYNEALTALDQALLRQTPHLPAAPWSAPGIAAIAELMRQQGEAQIQFQHRLIQFLQTITAFVETKDRSLGGAELREEVVRSRAQLLELQRAIEQLHAAPQTAPASTPAITSSPGTSMGRATYVGFEDQFRGSRDAIRARQADYVPLFAGAHDVIDVGCGRGELLELLRAQGITARGVDINPAMVEACRARGLAATEGDALSFLDQQPNGSLGGLIALQVVEHLDPPVLVRVLETAFLKLRPGAPLVLETINAACWMAFFETYLRDLTHARPLHPDTLRYLVQAAGFRDVDVRFRAPVEAQDRLPTVPRPSDPALAAIADAVNAHADRLNARLFSAMDYAVIARR